MKRTLRWIYFVGLCLSLMLPVLAIRALADDDDSGGGNLDPALQWSLADTAWGRREYDDAASLNTAYVEANPEESAVLEALWRNFQIFHSYRPDAAKSKDAFEKETDMCAKWLAKYSTSDKEKAGQAMWYEGIVNDANGNREQAITILGDLIKKFPGTSHEADADWTLGEWLRSMNRFTESIPFYQGYMKIAGATDQSAACAFRIGYDYEGLKDNQDAIAAYTSVLDGKYAWNGGNVGWGSIDAAHRVAAMGDTELARRFALKILDACPPPDGGGWTDIRNQAHMVLGDSSSLNVYVNPYIWYNFKVSTVNLKDGQIVPRTREPKLIVRLSGVTKAAPIKATLTLKIADDITSFPTDTLKSTTDDNGKKTLSTVLNYPDAAGNAPGDLWYNFKQEDDSAAPPFDLVVTRKWEKQGANWGNEEIRIQSSQPWTVFITLPNDKTSPNNVSMKPNEVRDGGKTFLYYNWYNMNQGMTIKFPVQDVADGVNEYYPAVHISRGDGDGRHPAIRGTGTDATFKVDEFNFDLAMQPPAPYSVDFNTTDDVYMDEISR